MFVFPYIPRPDKPEQPGAHAAMRPLSGLILLLAVAIVGFVALAP